MQQLIEKLISEPWIIPVLISWPLFLWFANFLIQKIIIKFFKLKTK